MASAVETQLPSANGGGATISDGVHKNLSQSTLRPHPLPSPPATETDAETETDSDAPSAPQPSSGTEASPSSNRTGDEDEDDRNTDDTSPVVSPITSPPYWINTHGGHGRTTSTTSVESIPTGGITLRDNENSSLDERGSACWAKSVEITDYVTVNGSTTNIGAFVVYNIRVETLSGSYMNIRKRYSEFDDFRWRLIRTFPNFEAAVPELPPKSIVSKFRPRFLEKRRAGLQYFLNCILLNPEFSGSPVLKEFLFS
ncbi:Phox-like protein [Hypomontagnella submonticulosa]|nr:Phox-like protein [Hypomontagnella submonticulosa]